MLWDKSEFLMTFFNHVPGKVEFHPIKTSGHGNSNCLYHSASLLFVGNENFHLLLRLLTSIELFLHYLTTQGIHDNSYNVYNFIKGT